MASPQISDQLKLWTLVDMDRKQTFVGQFIAEGVSRQAASNIAVASSPNRQNPIVQWISGREERITFTAKMWANNEDESIEDRIDRLEQLRNRQDDLRRPPICMFSLGNVRSMSMEVLVETLGGIQYSELRPDGTPRGVTFQIGLIKFVELPLEPTDPSSPDNMTRVRRAREGDTYESIAASEYGDPELGILLRQENPRTPGMDLADLSPGDGVHIFPETFLRTLLLQPAWHGLRSGPDNEAAEQARRNIFEARSDDGFSTAYADTSASER